MSSWRGAVGGRGVACMIVLAALFAAGCPRSHCEREEASICRATLSCLARDTLVSVVASARAQGGVVFVGAVVEGSVRPGEPLVGEEIPGGFSPAGGLYFAEDALEVDVEVVDPLDEPVDGVVGVRVRSGLLYASRRDGSPYCGSGEVYGGPCFHDTAHGLPEAGSLRLFILLPVGGDVPWWVERHARISRDGQSADRSLTLDKEWTPLELLRR